MKEILSKNGLSLIQKYNKYYIRFLLNDSTDVIPCDLYIAETEAQDIISGKKNIKNVLNAHRKDSDGTATHFIDAAITDSLYYDYGFSDTMIMSQIEKLNRHPDIKQEFYFQIIYDCIKLDCFVTENGYNAKMLMKDSGMSLINAYNYLIDVREKA